MNRTWIRWQLMTPVLALAFASCSKKNDDSSSPAAVPFQYFAATGKSVSIDMSTTKKGDTFVVMPFILGDTTAIAGGDLKVTAGSFIMSAPGAEAKPAGLVDSVVDPIVEPTPPSEQALEHMRRVVLNRFAPELGMNQTPGFWNIVDTLDADTASHAAPVARLLGSEPPTLRQLLSNSFHSQKNLSLAAQNRLLQLKQNHANLLADDGACPAAFVRPNPANVTDATTTAEIPEGKYTTDDQHSYCLVYVGDPVTESNKETIKLSVSTALRRYKDIVYKGIELKNAGDFVMKPIIIIAPFDNKDFWPDIVKYPVYKIAGGYIRSVTKDLSQPVLFMASDLSKVTGEADPVKAKDLWHGTIAHELHHAFIDYFKTRLPYTDDKDHSGSQELIGIDEGIAHYFEDLNGYLKYNFPTFTGAYLTTFFSDTASLPFLWAKPGTSGTDSEMRGSGHALMYYLTSRAGGVSFTNGEFVDSPGITFLRNVISSPGNGIGNLQKALTTSGVTTDWTTLIGQFLGALAQDGSNVVSNDPNGKTQGVTQNVTDTIGQTGKTSGFTFGNYGSVPDTTARVANAHYANSKDDPIPVSYYQTNPFLYIVSDPAQPGVVNFTDTYKNAGVMVVKLKNAN